MTKPLSRLKILQGAVGIYLVVYVVLGTLLDDPLLFSKMTPKRLDEALHKFNEPYGPAASTSHDIWTSNSCFSEMIKARHLTDYLWCKPVRLLSYYYCTGNIIKVVWVYRYIFFGKNGYSFFIKMGVQRSTFFLKVDGGKDKNATS